MEQNEAYKVAEEKIQQALQSGLSQLDLSGDYEGQGSKLSDLPESVSQLDHLECLILDCNAFETLPGWLVGLKNLRSLSLADNRFTQLPAWLGKMEHLEELVVHSNQISVEPMFLEELAQLRTLNLGGNQLSQLPTQIRKLRFLRELQIWGNKLISLPEWLPELKTLQLLNIHGNSFTSLPECILQMSKLKKLYIGYSQGGIPLKVFPPTLVSLTELEWLALDGCSLDCLPDLIGNFKKLKHLSLSNNQLKDLPVALSKLDSLEYLEVDKNPLNPELAAVSKKGIGAVKRYLAEMAKGGKDRFEAKLLILGDGNEGKTCVSRALRGLPFRKQNSTHGVDVVQWKFSHPDEETNGEKDITLNIWDFEGQEISHQTHQFFLTSQALYLLVFKCRDQFLLDRAEYWLDTIRARAPKAKVVIVISQCEKRSPHIPLDRIKSQYSEMLAEEWFFPIGCENGKNIEKLRTFLRRSAADLDFMGSPWPISYQKAETQIKERAGMRTPHITRSNLNSIFRKAGISVNNFEGAAAALARLGVITQFVNCADLRDLVVLKPQWLTKAISKVMEDGRLADDKGEIDLTRMEIIWNKAGYRGMFTTFHNCMKEFELCYDLEDQSQSCLVPLRFGYVQPVIPWSNDPDRKERRIEYKLNIRPPMGIMSRFIVKTHHMIVKTPDHPKGVYWHNGVFLRSNSPVPSEAVCEFIPDERIFRVQVRAAFPQNMCEQIHGYIQAVFSFFGGLSPERSYGCIKVNSREGFEIQCKGLHTEKRIYTAISKRRETIDCEFEEHEIDPRVLVYGFSSFSDFIADKIATVVREELERPPEWAAQFLRSVGALIKWVHENGGKLDQMLYAQEELSTAFKQEAELKLHEYLLCLSQMLDDRDHTSAPGLISIRTKERSSWNPTNFFKQTFILTPYCECEGNIHACDDGAIEFVKDKIWWAKSAPWVARSTNLLAAGLQLAFAGIPLALGADASKLIDHDLKFMAALTKHLELKTPVQDDYQMENAMGATFGKDLRGGDYEAALTRTALGRFLAETAPDNYQARRWGSLKRIKMSDNTFRWLCKGCAKRSQ